uniref:Non-structural glycoprotein 4 n=5 Tax=Avian rotavirus A TaxID=31563 RepID=I6TST8_9REOV|nr:nonstructural protein 4 [Avian rotavirus A]AFM82481.1 nonstructural protein 4 [Avian rotavirus A]AGM46561.1 nonstructural protein 4 [Avian rotavirus A]AGM46562.1 nonstructural protein 4 [Avian rotavirus A]AGM46572.1 nonstructural protein 4 [Avian rotavirus A]
MENVTTINETLVEEVYNITLGYFEHNVIIMKYFPFLASILTILFTAWKMGSSTLKVTKTVAGSGYKVIKVVIVTIFNCILKIFGSKTEIVPEDKMDIMASKILKQIDEQVKVIEQLTKRELEQVKLLADIYELLKYKSEETIPSGINKKAYDTWNKDPYQPTRAVSLN